MYHVSAQGVDDRMINVHYYYYYINHVLDRGIRQKRGVRESRGGADRRTVLKRRGLLERRVLGRIEVFWRGGYSGE